ncbi:zinc finger protein 391-like [Maniola hyperantus]|uniref:zinc finger protein 391-like n=1 Tax=Aphantopus hyperantus TaxID=2795564 RepID=UPI0015697CBF|nr:zinc finger protein 184-like [Maniola hyperantus]
MSLDLLVLNFDSGVYNFDYFQQEDVCRFCWKREASSPSTEIKVENDLTAKIAECLDIDITRCDHPKKICPECSSQIDKFFNFKKICQETEKKLREILSNHELIVENVKIENEDVDFKDGNFDNFLNCLKDSDGESERPNQKRSKWKHKPKRTATYCNICRLDFENASKIISHNSECHGIERGGFKCFGCEKVFRNRKSRLGHEQNFCKNLKDGYKCSMCDRYLPRRGMYEAHMQNHRQNGRVELPEEIFKCNKCNLLYKTMQLLKEHILTHKEDKKKYVCESCGRVFTRNDYLLKHKLTHTGEKQHGCPHCSFRATQRSSLVVHIRKHTGERPYQCSVCPQQCVSSSNLRAHQRRHLGIKMHECKICSKKFGYKVSLQEHMSTHAPAQTHACDQCAASYSRLRALKRHITAKHTEKIPAE